MGRTTASRRGASLLSAGVLAAVWALAPSPAWAGLVIGHIVIDSYFKPDLGPDQAGANLVMHYETNSNFGRQDCCKPGDLRWIQLAKPDPPGKFFPGHPKGPFIDPENNPNLAIAGGHPDNLPFYDVTYAKKGDVGSNNVNRGLGPYFWDQPAASRDKWPVSVTFETLLVCVDMTPNSMRMSILGGVQWGYKIQPFGKNFTHSRIPITQLDDGANLRKEFNDALTTGYPGWEIVSQSDLWNGPPLSVDVVPEPSSFVMAGSGAFALLLVIRRGNRSVGAPAAPAGVAA